MPRTGPTSKKLKYDVVRDCAVFVLIFILKFQNLNLQTLLSILNSTRAADIPGIVKSLPQDSQDTLMKYLYKGMAMPGWGDVSGSVLLGWHEKASVSDCPFCHCLTILIS